MKFIIYKGQKKFTVDNVIVHDQDSLQELMSGEGTREMSLNDLELYSLRITATRGLVYEAEEIVNEELVKEIDEGINWQQVTVN